jgi:hypothetical protein
MEQLQRRPSVIGSQRSRKRRAPQWQPPVYVSSAVVMASGPERTRRESCRQGSARAKRRQDG